MFARPLLAVTDVLSSQIVQTDQDLRPFVTRNMPGGVIGNEKSWRSDWVKEVNNKSGQIEVIEYQQPERLPSLQMCCKHP